jgi:hypothetical protein
MPLWYRAAGSTPQSAWKHGRSLDMSACGILIDVPQAMPLGSRWELSMNWPGLFHGTETVRLYLVVSVTRVDSRGVALRILSHRFHGAAMVRSQREQRKRAVA